MKEFLSVKEFSKLSGIENTTLRYWDEIGLFSPAKRDPENNYRYYAPWQVIAINFISVLSSLNVPLKTISEMEGIRNPENIIDLIDRQENLLDTEMRRLREAYSIIHIRRELIKNGMKVAEPNVSVGKLDSRLMVMGPPNHFREGGAFYEPFAYFCEQAKNLRINLGYPIGGYHDSMESFLNAPSQPDCFYSLDPTGNVEQPEGEYLIGHVHGYYGEFSDLPERMESYAKEHSLNLGGPVFTLYLQDEICVKEPDEYLSQISVAIVEG